MLLAQSERGQFVHLGLFFSLYPNHQQLIRLDEGNVSDIRYGALFRRPD